MRLEVEIQGIRETMENIRAFEKKADRELGLAMARVVAKVTRDLKEAAPFVTGFLKNNITPSPPVKQVRGRGIIGSITSAAKYSLIVEFGSLSRGRAPNRFIRNTIERNIPFIRETLGDSLKQIILKGNPGKGKRVGA